MARKTKEDAEKTRQQLLDAALQLFSDKGPAQVTLAEIARDAGTTRGAIYWHFKDKCSLLNCLWEESIAPIEKAFDVLIASEPEDPLESLRQLTAEVLTRLVSTPRIQQIFKVLQQAASLPELSGELMKMHCEQQTALALYFQSPCNKKELRPCLSPDMAAVLYLSSVDGLIHYWLTSPESIDLANNIELLTQTWIDMLRV